MQTCINYLFKDGWNHHGEMGWGDAHPALCSGPVTGFQVQEELKWCVT